MTTMNSRLIPLTDHRGAQLLPEDERFEPEPGSIVLVRGNHGTAMQKFFSDGLWYAVGRTTGMTWEWILSQRNVVLVYDASERA